MLYAWRKFGYQEASNEFFKKFYTKQRASDSIPKFVNVLKGKLLFLQMVKGPRDRVYVSLAKSFNSLISEDERPLRYLETPDKERNALNSVWVLETLYDDQDGELKASQGTGFMVKGVGIVTCAHVVSEDGNIFKDIKAFQANSIGNKYNITVNHIDNHRDIAILKIDAKEANKDTKNSELKLDLSDEIGQKTPVTLIGFPSYKLGQSPYLADGKIASVYAQSGVKKFEIDILIREGNSGGPVLNSNLDVIGIAAEGAEKTGGNNAVIRICELVALLNQNIP